MRLRKSYTGQSHRISWIMAGIGFVAGIFVDLVTSPLLDAMHDTIVDFIDDILNGPDFFGMDALLLVCKVLAWIIIYLPAPTVASVGGFALSKKLPSI